MRIIYRMWNALILAALVDWYVSTAHRNDPADSCGVLALGPTCGASVAA